MMIEILESLTKAAVGLAVTPIDLTADVITLGGALNDKGKPYTVKRVEQVMGNLKNACEPSSEIKQK